MLLVLLACGPVSPEVGEGDGAAALVADILVGEPRLDFGLVPTSEVATKILTVYNDGTADLTLGEVGLVDTTGLFTLSAPNSTVIAPGGNTGIVVSFAPIDAVEAVASVLVYSDDPDQPRVEVGVTAEAEAAAVRIEPTSWDFGRVEPTCADSALFSVVNDGSATLTVTAIEVAGGDGGFVPDAREDVNGPLPWTLGPGAERFVSVAFAPPYFSDFSGSLVVRSDDPTNPAAGARIDGEGVDYPAVADAYTTDGGDVDIVMAVTPVDLRETLEDLVDAFPGFVAALDDRGVDFQLAVGVSENGGTEGSDPYLSADMPLATQESIFEAMLVDSGTRDHGFLLASEAMEADKLTAGQCNEGMLREGVRLAVVGVTIQTGQPNDGWQRYVDDFQDLVETDRDLEVHGISGKPQEGCGENGASSGWHEAASSTGGADLNVCDPETDNLLALAQAIAEPQRIYPLSDTPQADTLSVTVDGAAVNGWAYEASDNSVVFDRSVAPAIGTEVIVAYDALAECP